MRCERPASHKPDPSSRPPDGDFRGSRAPTLVAPSWRRATAHAAVHPFLHVASGITAPDRMPCWRHISRQPARSDRHHRGNTTASPAFRLAIRDGNAAVETASGRTADDERKPVVCRDGEPPRRDGCTTGPPCRVAAPVRFDAGHRQSRRRVSPDRRYPAVLPDRRPFDGTPHELRGSPPARVSTLSRSVTSTIETIT